MAKAKVYAVPGSESGGGESKTPSMEYASPERAALMQSPSSRNLDFEIAGLITVDDIEKRLQTLYSMTVRREEEKE